MKAKVIKIDNNFDKLVLKTRFMQTTNELINNIDKNQFDDAKDNMIKLGTILVEIENLYD